MNSQTRPSKADQRAFKRIKALVLVVSLLAGLTAVRALWVQGIDAQGMAAAALNRLTNKPVTLQATRGVITDRTGAVLAQTLPYVRVISDPYGIVTNGVVRTEAVTDEQRAKAAEGTKKIADILMTYLGGSADDYMGHLTAEYQKSGRPNQYEVIAANVPAYTYAKIVAAMNKEGLYGLYSEATPIRIYPDGALASNVLGFVGSDGNGLAGFELSQNDGLTGIPGTAIYESGPYGTIPLGNNTLVPAVNGYTYRLTLDATMQMAAQQEILQAVARAQANYGVVIVMDVKTGEVLAMADAPTFDNNAFGGANQADTGNRAVEATYEPGSVQKVLTMAALIDQGLITPDTKVVVPPSLDSPGSVITDDWKHDTMYLTARGVLAYSSNIGTAMLCRQSSKQALADYLTSFGLGKPTGIQLPGEGNSNLGIVPGGDMPDYQRDRVAFGQSISVTAMQEAAAVAAVVNGGVYHQPTLIASVTDANGRLVPQPALAARQVVSASTSAAVLNMMQAVTESSLYSKNRSIPGYTWAGKTGTAQRVDEATGRYQGTTASFIGVAPAVNPSILVYVVVDNPAGGAAGAQVAFPAARDLMEVALPHYGIQQTETSLYTDPLTFEP